MTVRFESVHASRFHEDVSRQIARSIIRGDFRPLEPIPSEAVLIEEFRVSRAVVREALRTLQQRGLLEMAQGKRTVVTEESQWDVLDPLVIAAFREVGRIKPLVRDFLWIRMRLEPEIAAEAALRVDDAALAELDAILERMEATQDSPAAFFEVDMEYHNRLAAAVDNRVLGRLMGTIGYSFYVSRDLALDTEHAPIGALQWHREVQRALRERDPDAARAAMKGHLDWTYERIMGRLEEA
jgi:DNA-binding FadR family transcriptional regulator